MEKFYIITNRSKDRELATTHRIQRYIEQHGGQCIVASDGKCVPKDTECVLVLGGDGTLIRAARELRACKAPLLGINLGTLGYLTEVEVQNIEQALEQLFEETPEIEARMMLKGVLNRGQEDVALNDIVVGRAGALRIIHFNIYVNGELLNSYQADGVIISTPTGSTGYNLSAGGPIISPKSKAVVVTPISPHSLTSKSVVFDSADRIRIEVVKKRRTQETEAIVSFDGADNIELSAGESVEVTCSKREIRLIKMYDVSFYSVLREKIGGA